ncbi:probable glutamate receptor [Myxocyprinus asiaticus]|uniref:probable glutamate receptor n=1 Tax=Myxocyprinus asiaticus TaxID=70543 RepID=UPI002221FB52|nr:probable glutamate receptor [Myxocyprinus asiaticus]
MAPLEIIFITSALLAGTRAAGPQPLRVTTIKEEPYVMSKGSELEGFCIDLLSALSKKLDFKYDVHMVKDGRYGTTDDSGNWNGMIGEVVRGEADIAVAPLTLTAKREEAVDMTKPYMQTGISFILRKGLASEDSHFLSLLHIFSTEMWISVLVAYLLTSVCIFLVARISPCEWKQPEKEQNSFPLSHSFWYTVGALTLQGVGPHPKALSGRVITAIWWLFSLVLLACYFANLSSWLRSDNEQLSFKSFEDLANQNLIEYGTIKDSSTFTFFKNSNNPTYHRIYEHIKKAQSYSLSAEEGIRKAQKGNYAFIGESVFLDLAVARYCNLTRAPEIISMRGYSIAAPLGSPLIKNLSVAILRLSESGELDYLHSKWWVSSCLANNGKSSPLKPASLKGIFLILALGLGLGLFIALMELASKSRNIANTQQKSCCSVFSAELSQRFRGGEVTKPGSSDKNKA